MTTMRRSLTTADPTAFAPHDHVAWGGAGQETLDRVAVAAFTKAAHRGERMLFVADLPSPDRLDELEGRDELMERGALHLATVADTYDEPIDIAAQQAGFETFLDESLAEGYSGICVVADNTDLAVGSEAAFADWLHWEATADRLQATRPINGVCFFDVERVPTDRLADLAAMHPVLSAAIDAPRFRVFAEDDAVKVIGDLDLFCSEQLHRVLLAALDDRPIDLEGVDFIDHRALLALNCAASGHKGVQITGARPIVRQVWELLDVPDPALEFC